MSIKVSTRVWEQSTAVGSELLMLLAIADFADEEGRAFPSIPTLARRCRMGERNAMYLLKALQERGELRVLRGASRRGTNLYQIVFAATKAENAESSVAVGTPLQPVASLHSPAPPHSLAPLQPNAPPQPSSLACEQAEGGSFVQSGSRRDADGLPLGEVQRPAVEGAAAFTPG